MPLAGQSLCPRGDHAWLDLCFVQSGGTVAIYIAAKHGDDYVLEQRSSLARPLLFGVGCMAAGWGLMHGRLRGLIGFISGVSVIYRSAAAPAAGRLMQSQAPLQPAHRPSRDKIEEASVGSFPASDAPG
jgi:hypothetical protein